MGEEKNLKTEKCLKKSLIIFFNNIYPVIQNFWYSFLKIGYYCQIKRAK